MDRKGIIGVVLCLAAYFAISIFAARMYPPPVHHPAPAAGTASADTNAPTLSAAPSNTPAPASADVPAANAAPTETASALPEKTDELQNNLIKVTFSSRGASIKQIELKEHREGDKNVILNDESHSNVMALTGWPGSDSTAFEITGTPSSFAGGTVPAPGTIGGYIPGTLTYTATLGNGVTWTRTYSLDQDYTITVKDTLTNAGTSATVLPAYSLSLGRAKPLLVKGVYQPISSQYLGAGWLTTQKYHLTTISAFNPQGWFFNPGPPRDLVASPTIDTNPLRWVAVEDQFFAVLLTPDSHYPATQATFQCFNARDEKGYILSKDIPNIEASVDFPQIQLPVGQSTAITYTVYAGPKEYGRLNALGENQGELMNYDGFLPFSLLIRPMLWVLHGVNSVFHSYGIAIILLTLIIKAITWPLQSFANRSGKRMQALAPKIKELQAKYKDQPEKVSAETFSLYRDYGVNPFGGCLPAFIQMPVFFSLYYMLQNAVELRGQHFLWIKDLTQPDTIFSTALPFSFLTISHITINPLPIMVTALMAVMMRMTPQIGDPQQQKVAQFMPLFFLFLFYNFAAALSLYYVFNNAVAIIQIYRNLKKPLPELVKKPRPPGK